MIHLSIGSRIKEARNNLKLTQEELAKSIGVTKGAIANYENEVSIPRIELLYKLFSNLKCDANYLYQDDMDLLNIEFKVSLIEERHLTKYRRLDEYGKEVTDTVVDLELKRIEKEMTIMEQKIEEQEEMKLKIVASKKQSPKLSYEPYIEEVPTFNATYFDDLPVSAGDGNYSMDLAHSVVVPLKNQPPYGTSYIVKVSGASMEPTLYDGDKIFIGAQANLNVGEIGVFVVDACLYVKEYGGAEGLLSHNPDYPDVKVTEFSEFKCLGKYLGKCEENFK